MSASTSFEERLDFWTCFFLKSRVHPVYIVNTYQNDNVTYREHNLTCGSYGTTILATSEEGGRILCILLCCLIFIVGFIGVILNILNVILLPKCFSGRSQHFKESLVLLSVVELALNVTTIAFTYVTLAIMDDVWGHRGQAMLIILLIVKCLFNVTSSMSVFLTILISFERFIMIGLPVRFHLWLRSDGHQTWKSRLPMIIVLIWSVLLNLYWASISTVVKNDYYFPETNENYTRPSDLERFSYLVKRNNFLRGMPGLELCLMVLDFFVPFPLLLIFNLLLYRAISIWHKSRSGLSAGQHKHKRDIQAGKMFLIVVLVSLVTHFISVVIFVTTWSVPNIFIDVYFLQRLSMVIAASVHFVIYYWFYPGFQLAFWKMVKQFTLCSKDSESTANRWENWINKKIDRPGAELETQTSPPLKSTRN